MCFDEKVCFVVLAGKCVFAVNMRFCGKMRFPVLEGKYIFLILAGICVLRFWRKNAFILVLAEKCVYSRFGGKMHVSDFGDKVCFYSFGVKVCFWFLCGFTGLAEKCFFMEMCVFTFLRKSSFYGFGGKFVIQFWRENAFFWLWRKNLYGKI